MAKVKQKLIEVDLTDCCTKPDSTLLSTFFPNPGDSQGILDALGVEYGDVDRRTAKGPTGRRGKDNLKRGWIRMPNPPASKEKSTFKENAITAVFVPILNSIIAKLHLSDLRVAVDRQSFVIPTWDGGSLKPDVIIWGKGSPAFPPIEGTPSSITRNKSHKDLEAMRNDHGVEEEGPPVDWPWCVIPVEIKTDRNRGGPDNVDALHQLGTYVREVFAAQENRRFVPSLILTECTVEFLLWDRVGVVASERLDYHSNPLLFCHMLASLATWDDRQLGFDGTVFHRGQELHIRTQEFVEYIVEETLFHAYTLRGRGSTCWRVRKLQDDGARYVIMDSWVSGGMGAEQVILRKLEDTRVNDGIAGIAPLVHIEEVETSGPTPHRDTVKHNRRCEIVTGINIVDLIHTRTVLQCDGQRLENSTSAKELVCALHDVIQGRFPEITVHSSR
jgi:hypothetical protein